MIKRIDPNPRWSDVTIFNETGYFVEVPDDVDVSIDLQIKQVLEQAQLRMASFGSDKSLIVSATIYLTDRAFVSAFNTAWEAWLPAGSAPSRACLIVDLVNPSMLVEIAFVVAIEK